MRAAHWRTAFIELLILRSQSVIRGLAKRDRTLWLTDRLDDVATDIDKGQRSSFWGLIRTLSGRKRRGPPAAAVMRRPDGSVIMDPIEATDAWELKFLSEFGGNGAVLQPGQVEPTVAFTPFVLCRPRNGATRCFSRPAGSSQAKPLETTLFRPR